jgi:hypothetical protein
MKHRRTRTSTHAERRYVNDMHRSSALERVYKGRASVLRVDELPEPLSRFLARERTMLHLRLSRAMKRKLESLSRNSGISVDELARRWIEQGLSRDAG